MLLAAYWVAKFLFSLFFSSVNSCCTLVDKLLSRSSEREGEYWFEVYDNEVGVVGSSALLTSMRIACMNKKNELLTPLIHLECSTSFFFGESALSRFINIILKCQEFVCVINHNLLGSCWATEKRRVCLRCSFMLRFGEKCACKVIDSPACWAVSLTLFIEGFPVGKLKWWENFHGNCQGCNRFSSRC